MKKSGISLDSLNLKKQCEESVEVEYITPDGTATGVFLQVIGKHAEKIHSLSLREIDRRRTIAENQSKTGKGGFVPSIEDEDYVIKDAAARISGWRGIDQEYSPEMAEQLCRMNAAIRELVVTTSNDLALFTRGK